MRGVRVLAAVAAQVIWGERALTKPTNRTAGAALDKRGVRVLVADAAQQSGVRAIVADAAQCMGCVCISSNRPAIGVPESRRSPLTLPLNGGARAPNRPIHRLQRAQRMPPWVTPIPLKDDE